MALSTQDELASAINIMCPWRGWLPTSGTVLERGDFQQLAYLCQIPPSVNTTLDTLGVPVVMSRFPFHELSRPLQVPQEWQTVIVAGGIDGADNGGSDITNPDTEIAGLPNRLIKVAQRGTFIEFRLAYDDGLSSITDPVIQVFGRYNAQEQWQRLKNLNDAIDVTVVTAATDVTNATLDFTHPDPQDQTVDLNGTDEVVVGVKTALSATGDVTTAYLQAKLVSGIRTY